MFFARFGARLAHKLSPRVLKRLFAALLFALTSADEVSRLYPGTQEMDLIRTLPSHWKITYHSSLVFRVDVIGQHLTYHISPLGAAR